MPNRRFTPYLKISDQSTNHIVVSIESACRTLVGKLFEVLANW